MEYVAGMADSSSGGSDASSSSSRGFDTDVGSVSGDCSEASDDSSGSATSSSSGSSSEDRTPETKRSKLMHSQRSGEKFRRPRPRTARSNDDEVVETWEEHVRSFGRARLRPMLVDAEQAQVAARNTSS